MTSPADQLYTRQQVAKLVGVSDDVLAYWLKQGLLVPTSGGDGRGDHRRFDFVQVNIAAVFAQLREFGSNIGALRSLADTLQASAKLGAAHQLHPSNYSTAAWLADRLHQFRAGEPVLIRAHGYDEKPPEGLNWRERSNWSIATRAAESEHEVISDSLSAPDEYDTDGAILAVAESIGPNRRTEAKAYADLVYQVLRPGYSDTFSWLVSIRAEKPCQIEFGDDASFFGAIASGSPEDFGTAIFLPISGIIRKLWGLKPYSEHRRERDEAYIKEKVLEAGVETSLSLVNGEDGTFRIEAPAEDLKAIAAALKGTRFEVSEDEA